MSQRQLVTYKLMALFLVLFILSWFLYIILELLPAKLWVEYHDIYPVSQVVKMDKPIEMISKASVHMPCDAQFNDILRCNDYTLNDKWSFHSDQSTKHLGLYPSMGPFEGPWSYKTVFSRPKKCYMESNVILKIRFGPFYTEKILRFNDKLADVKPHHFIQIVE